MRYEFQENFYWGSATSSYQVEGGITNNDWAEAAREGKVPPAGKSADHYNRYEENFDIAKNLSQNAHRLSLEWARIEPEEGRFDEKEIKHYAAVLNSLKQKGIEPFVTLYHFTLPLWFAKKGGWANSNAPQIFANYCKYAVEKLGASDGGGVRYWITINEPIILAFNGYLRGAWPPFNKNIFKFWKVIKTLISSHLMSHNIIKGINPDFQVGIAKNNIYFENNPLGSYFWNFYFLNKISDFSDFIGLNYYFHKRLGGNKNKKTTDMGWEIYPEGIHHVLKDLKKYKKPIYITENGMADKEDKYRADFIKDHLFWCHKAIQEEVDLRGYFYWSLLDNFEWAHGFSPRFGLVEIDYATMERKIRPSAYEYAEICGSNVLQVDL